MALGPWESLNLIHQAHWYSCLTPSLTYKTLKAGNKSYSTRYSHKPAPGMVFNRCSINACWTSKYSFFQNHRFPKMEIKEESGKNIGHDKDAKLQNFCHIFLFPRVVTLICEINTLCHNHLPHPEPLDHHHIPNEMQGNYTSHQHIITETEQSCALGFM